MKQRTIILDVDGVLAAFDEAIIKLVRPETTEEEVIKNADWDIFKLFSPDQMTLMKKTLEDPQFWSNLAPKKSSQVEVEAARKEGHRVVFCTSPWESCQSWDYVRREWLKKHFDAKGREDVIITGAKDLVFGDVFIDDRPAFVEMWKKKWEKKGGKALLYETAATTFDPQAMSIYPRVRVVNERWEFISRNKIGE